MGNYVGIDPSTKTGFVILNKDGEIINAEEVTTKEKGDIERFVDIATHLSQSIEMGDKVMIEGFSYGSRGKGVSTQYGIGWIIRENLFREFIDYVEVAPSGLKKFATGKGNTKKENMILPIYQKWGFESDSDNIRDAFVLAQIGRALDGLEPPTKYQDEVIKKVKGG